MTWVWTTLKKVEAYTMKKTYSIVVFFRLLTFMHQTSCKWISTWKITANSYGISGYWIDYLSTVLYIRIFYFMIYEFSVGFNMKSSSEIVIFSSMDYRIPCCLFNFKILRTKNRVSSLEHFSSWYRVAIDQIIKCGYWFRHIYNQI